MRQVKTKRQALEEFIGSHAVENDDSWTKEVWYAAWDAAMKAFEARTEDHDLEYRVYIIELIDELR